MKKYTDFLINLKGIKDCIEFRHSAATVSEFLSLESDLIFDLYGVQAIRKNEIVSVQLSPIPYVYQFIKHNGRLNSNQTELWAWVDSVNGTGWNEIKYIAG